MQQVKRQAERDIGKPPQDRDTRDYQVGGRKPVTKPRKSDREPDHHHPLGKVHPQACQLELEEEENPRGR